jgi:hypothetical protein
VVDDEYAAIESANLKQILSDVSIHMRSDNAVASGT